MQLWFVSYIDRMEIEITETRSMNAVSSQQIYSLRTDTEPVMWLSNSIPNIPCNIENFMTYYRKTWYIHVGGKTVSSYPQWKSQSFDMTGVA